MGRQKSHYLTVANRKNWTLDYPRRLWESMTADEQQDVVARQAALFDKMERKMRAVRRSKNGTVKNV